MNIITFATCAKPDGALRGGRFIFRLMASVSREGMIGNAVRGVRLKSAAAPAAVSGEPRIHEATGVLCSGKADVEAATREPEDLPARRLRMGPGWGL